MCWSLRVSLGSLALAWSLSALLWRRNWQTDRWWAAVLGFVALVQGGEALLWLDQGCTGLNQAASLALLAVICLEPLAHALAALACTPRPQRTKRMWGLAHANALFGAALAAQAGPRTADWCSLPCAAEACGCHLRWNWTAHINDTWRLAFLAFLAAPLLFMRPRAHGLAGAAYAAITFAAAHLVFHPHTVFESMWCWLAVGAYAIPLLLCRPAAAAGGDTAVAGAGAARPVARQAAAARQL